MATSVFSRMSVWISFAALWVAVGASAATVEISIPGPPFVQYKFFHELLKESLEAQGHQVTLKSVEGLTQDKVYSMLETGDINIFWGLKTRERDHKFLRVSNRLTKGLYGERVAFVRKGQETMFQGVKNVDDLRKTGKIAGLGQNWFDVDVWVGNDLPVYRQPGDWKPLFNMLASGKPGIDYFPRGAIEIVDEAKAHPNLSIEPNLLMVYDHDAFFYMSKNAEQLKHLVEEALVKADSSGIRARLLKTHFGQISSQLNFEKRTRIFLKTPNQAQLVK